MSEQLRDKNGLTEGKFLAMYQQKDYPKPSLTADIVIFRPSEASEGESPLELLLIRRGGHPYLGCWALPGGFVNQGEDADAAAARELAEETGIEGLQLEQLGLYSAPGRDPRCWTVSEAYLAVCEAGQQARAGDDAADTGWFALSCANNPDGTCALSAMRGDVALSVTFTCEVQRFSSNRARVSFQERFAFDHAQIVADAYLRLGLR